MTKKQMLMKLSKSEVVGKLLFAYESLQLMEEKLTAPNTPSAKCYSVECPAIWFNKCTSVKYAKCSVRESE